MGPASLEGVKVLDFTAAFVGPFCSRIMADMGAEVIKIERPVENQENRFTPRIATDQERCALPASEWR